MARDLSLEITGSSEKAVNSLDKIIQKLTEYQNKLISTIPKMNQFNNLLKNIPSGSGNRYKELANGINTISQALKKFDNKTPLNSLKNELEMIKRSSAGLDVTAKKLSDVANAMNGAGSASKLSTDLAKYQSQIDIASAKTKSAMSKAAYDTENYTFKSEKLAKAREKVAEAEQKIAQSKAFDTGAKQSLDNAVAREAERLKNKGSTSNYIPETSSKSYKNYYSGRHISAEVGATQRTMFVPEIDTSSFKAKIQEIKSFIKNLTPAVENMSQSAQNKFFKMANNLRSVNAALEKQKQLYSNLTKDYQTISQGFGTDSNPAAEIEKRMKSTSKYIEDLTAKSNNLKKSMEKLITPTNNAGSAIEKAGKSSNKASKELSTFDRVVRNLGTYLLIKGINEVSKAFSGALSSAMNFIENINLFNVAMGENVYKAGEFIDKMSTAFGMDPSNLVKTMGNFYQISHSMGVTSKNAYVLSENFTKLANDLSSFYNISVADATTKLQAGLVGETEPLRRLGIIITENSLKQTAANLGIQKSVRDMSEAEKMHLRYITVLEQTKNVQGDFARTIAQPAQLVKILQEQISQLSRAIGSVFMPILGAVLPYIIAFTRVLTTAIKALASLVGYKAPDYQNLSVGLGSGLDTAAGNADNLGSSVGKATEKVKEFKKQTMGFDELHILEAPKDDPSSSGSPSGGGGVGGGDFSVPDLTGYDNLMDSVNSKIDEIYNHIMDTFSKIGKAFEPTIEALGKLWDQLKIVGSFAWTGLLDFYNLFLKPVGSWILGEGLPRFIDAITNGLSMVDWGKINDSLKNLWNALAPFAIAVGEGLLWFWESVLVPLGTWTINNAVPAFLDLIAGAINFLTPIVTGCKDALSWLWEVFLKPIAEWTGGVICAVLKSLGEGLSVVGDWMSQNQELISNIALIVASFGAAWVLVNGAIALWNIIGLIATGITTAFGAAVAFLTSPIGLVILAIGAVIAIAVLLIKHWDDIKAAATDCWNAIVGVWNAVSGWFNSNIIQPLSNFFTMLWNSIISTAQNCWNTIVGVWNAVSSWFYNNVISPLVNFFSGLWNSITGIFGSISSWFGNIFWSAYNAVTGAFSGVTGFFNNIWNNITSIFSGIGTAIGNAIGGSFKNVVNSVINFAQNTINGFIRAINSAISVVNNIPGVNIRQISELSIPRLARGGLTTKSVLANIGEGKDEEAILPLNDAVYAKLAEGINKNNADNNPVISEESLYRAFLRALQDAPEKTATFVATLNNKIIAKEVIKEQENAHRRFNPVKA